MYRDFYAMIHNVLATTRQLRRLEQSIFRTVNDVMKIKRSTYREQAIACSRCACCTTQK
jgi:hypothetical protein